MDAEMSFDDAIDFFRELGTVIDDLDIYDLFADDFSERYNKALATLKLYALFQ